MIYDIQDMGGMTDTYIYTTQGRAAAGIAETVIGDCVSACTLRSNNPRFCVQPTTRFLFHGTIAGAGWEPHIMQYYPPKIQRWLYERGGLGSPYEYKILTGPELWRLIPLCR